ncbi:hypothetical protein BDM02DRAFT_3188657 [Thelephora ganbajun]|uniref:Uncharacterized protein n=1 Tax=Thelephora ganbajun TaxID=370292 RepID=A0ACB6ZAD1_THEGA|nr:hypothetical protein BDM02DRAFT_3188657 [Thelephora ganbajun]
MPPKTKRRRPTENAPAPRRSRQPPAPNPNPYQHTTDRSLIDKPVHAHIHFKRGTEFNEDDDDPYPEYDRRGSGDITESDANGSLQPYKPMDYTPRYRFDCEVTLESFMNWTEGQLQEITYSKARKQPKKRRYIWTTKTRRIPVLYVRIVHQFILEDAHGKKDMGHKSLHRRTYAQRIPDAYGPSIQSAISLHDGEPTISQVTAFYLGNDPLDPRCIPSYRRNLLYTREAMWHLAVLMGMASRESRKDFSSSLDVHDMIMGGLTVIPCQVTQGIPLFNELDVLAIVTLEIEAFFDRELKHVPGLLAPLLELREISQRQQPAALLRAAHLRAMATRMTKVAGHHRTESESTSGSSKGKDGEGDGEGDGGEGNDDGEGNGNDDGNDDGDGDDDSEGEGSDDNSEGEGGDGDGDGVGGDDSK